MSGFGNASDAGRSSAGRLPPPGVSSTRTRTDKNLAEDGAYEVQDNGGKAFEVDGGRDGPASNAGAAGGGARPRLKLP